MITKIKDRLRGNSDEIRYILEELNCHNIKPIHDKFRFGKDEDGSGTGNSLDINTLQYKSFSSDIYGDILTLTSEILFNNDLGRAIKWLANKLHIKIDYSQPKDIKLPFGGFFKNIHRIREMDDSPPISYPIQDLYEYGCTPSKLFLDDNIDCKTQELFHVGYDPFTNRVTIPWFNFDEFCGCVGRQNRKVVEGNFKYLALEHINKSKLLFGLHVNYNSIIKNGLCYVFESEKSTMQLYSYGLPFGISIGCKTISEIQAKLLKSMYVDVVLCFDEGVDEQAIKKECDKIKIKNPFFTNKVGYIYDRNGVYLQKGTKDSPSDNGISIFNKLCEECIIWV